MWWVLLYKRPVLDNFTQESFRKFIGDLNYVPKFNQSWQGLSARWAILSYFLVLVSPISVTASALWP